MYEGFYGFREKPFSLTPDPAFLYLGKTHGVGLTMLRYGMGNRAGITVLTGEIGAGKTTLIRRLLDELDDDVEVGLISNTHESFGSLLHWVLTSFGIDAAADDKATLHDEFGRFLIENYARGKRTVLIVDEAQNLAPTTLEELRLLNNINADKDQVLQLVLVGQPELRSTLRLPELQQFVQRIEVDYHLAPLTAESTDDYIRHRLAAAGGNPDLFESAARRFIHYVCDGVPRLINSLCDTALVYAFADGAEQIDGEMVRAIVSERAGVGLFGAGLSSKTLNALEEDSEAATLSLLERAQADVLDAENSWSDNCTDQ